MIIMKISFLVFTGILCIAILFVSTPVFAFSVSPPLAYSDFVPGKEETRSITVINPNNAELYVKLTVENSARDESIPEHITLSTNELHISP